MSAKPISAAQVSEGVSNRSDQSTRSGSSPLFFANPGTTELFNGITLADDESAENLRLTLRGAKGKYGYIPMTLIVGGVRVGKTQLMELILRIRFGEARWTKNPKWERDWHPVLDRVADSRYVAFDNLPRIDFDSLNCFLTSTHRSYRARGRNDKMITKKISCQVFATAPEHVKISTDSLRRIRVIRLATPLGGRMAQFSKSPVVKEKFYNVMCPTCLSETMARSEVRLCGHCGQMFAKSV